MIEVNPGADRAGASVLRSIGEATKSNRIPASAEALLLVRLIKYSLHHVFTHESFLGAKVVGH